MHDLKPGHPVYESIRAEVLDEQEPLAGAGEAAVLASLDAKPAQNGALPPITI